MKQLEQMSLLELKALYYDLSVEANRIAQTINVVNQFIEKKTKEESEKKTKEESEKKTKEESEKKTKETLTSKNNLSEK